MAELRLEGLRKSFGSTEVIHGVDLAVDSGEFVVFVGPSGCGKSTLLRMIAGLERASAGTIRIEDRDVTHTDPSKRGIAMVFQTYALYPHMSVAENMGFGLEMAGMPAAERRAKVEAAARTLNLDGLLERKPRQLSGGQRQRVAIGRAIVRDPKVFLFDEPLSNLDAELRVRMRQEIARLHADLGATMVYVTHDQVEAMTLATRIVVINEGVIEQVGSPLDLYRDPDNTFVGGFIGSPRMNMLEGVVRGRADGDALKVDIPRLGAEGLAVPVRGPAETAPAKVTVGIRPEFFRPVSQAGATTVTLRCDAIEQLGGVSYVYVDPGTDDVLVAEVRGIAPARPGDMLHFELDAGACFLFDENGRRL